VPQNPVGKRFFVFLSSTNDFVEATALQVFEKDHSMKRIWVFAGRWLKVQRLNDMQGMSVCLSRPSVSC
jgi:hypothetical protein